MVDVHGADDRRSSFSNQSFRTRQELKKRNRFTSASRSARHRGERRGHPCPPTGNSCVWRIVDGEIKPTEAVKACHAELKRQKISPRRSLAKDLTSANTETGYARNR
jgi:hypothetical protein